MLHMLSIENEKWEIVGVKNYFAIDVSPNPNLNDYGLSPFLHSRFSSANLIHHFPLRGFLTRLTLVLHLLIVRKRG